MPADYTIDAARGLILSRLHGVLTDSDLAGWQERLHADPAFVSTLDHLVDTSDVSGVGVTAAGVRHLAEHAPTHRTGRRVLVAPVDVLYGLGRMYGEIREAGELPGFEVVRTRAEAYALLALPAPDDGPAATR